MKTNEFLNKKGKIMIFIILFFLGLMQGLSIFLKATNSIIDIPKVYPFSIYFFKINWAGLPYMIIFLVRQTMHTSIFMMHLKLKILKNGWLLSAK
ncbi:MAG: hypothetical protein C4K58_01670 [Flavobacteriaceae bacterium]|nr:MAG: hypothetical protein C4K58_01670 [Flavobacteriaceae bacterium]